MKKILFLFLCFVISLTLMACNSENIKDALDDLKTLDTPLVTISEDGIASWEKVKHAEGYAYKINNESAVKTDELEVQLEYGDSIRVKALGDGEKYEDSKYSARLTYEGSAVGPTEEETKIPTVELTPEKTPTEVVGEESKTIVFYHAMGASLREVLDVKIEEFENLNPGWEIDAINVGGYEDIYNTIMGNMYYNNTPDIAFCYPQHVANYLQTGKVIDLNEFIYSADGYSDWELQDFIPNSLLEGTVTNLCDDYKDCGYNSAAMLSMPFLKSTDVMYYNATCLEKLGLEVPRTWEELWKACEIIKTVYPYATPLGVDSEANWFYNMAEQNGWDFLSTEKPYYLFNNYDVLSWLNDSAEHYNKGYFYTANINDVYASNSFLKGEDGGCIFAIGSSAGAIYHNASNFEWGVAPIPGVYKDGYVDSSSLIQGASLVMFESNAANSSEKELKTWEFMKILLDPKTQAMFSMASGYASSRLSSLEIPTYQMALEDETNISAVALHTFYSNRENLYAPLGLKNTDVIREELGYALYYSYIGQNTPAYELSIAFSKISGNYIDNMLYDAAFEFENNFDFTDNKSEEYISLPSAYTYEGINVEISSWYTKSSDLYIDGNRMHINNPQSDEIVKVYACLEYLGEKIIVSFDFDLSLFNTSNEPISVQEFISNANPNNQALLHGYITAVNSTERADSFILTDEFGDSIFCYDQVLNVKLGDEVIISAKYNSYNGFPQMASPSLVEILSEGNDVASTSGELFELSIDEVIESLSTDYKPIIDKYSGKYLKITGCLTQNPFFGLSNVNGGTEYVSIYANKSLDFANYIGQNITIYCFLRGASVNIINVQVQGFELAELSDEEKASQELAKIHLEGEFKSGEYDLPVSSNSDVKISYLVTSGQEYVTVVNGKLIVKEAVLPKLVVIYAYASCGNVVLTKEFNISVYESVELTSIGSALKSEDGTKVIIEGWVYKIESEWNGYYGYMSIKLTDLDNTIYVFQMPEKVEIDDLVRIYGVVDTQNGIKIITDISRVDVVQKFN